MKQQKSYHAKPSEIKQQWYLIDAQEMILGRLASAVAKIIRGKQRPTYTPSQDMGDIVIVINAEKIKVTGNKEQDKMYYSHSMHPQGLKSISLKDLRKKDAAEIIHRAVKGMIPKYRLGRHLLKKVKVYTGSTHPHEAQNPVLLDIKK